LAKVQPAHLNVNLWVYSRKLNYLQNNLVKACFVEKAEDYLLSNTKYYNSGTGCCRCPAGKVTIEHLPPDFNPKQWISASFTKKGLTKKASPYWIYSDRWWTLFPFKRF